MNLAPLLQPGGPSPETSTLKAFATFRCSKCKRLSEIEVLGFKELGDLNFNCSCKSSQHELLDLAGNEVYEIVVSPAFNFYKYARWI